MEILKTILTRSKRIKTKGLNVIFDDLADTLFFKKVNFNDAKGLEFWRSKIFSLFVDIILMFATPLFVWGAYLFYVQGNYIAAGLEIAFLALIVSIVKCEKINEKKRRILGISILYISGLFLLIFAGNLGCGMVILLFSFVFVGFVLNIKESAKLIVINFFVIFCLTLMLFYGLMDGFAISSYKGFWLINIIPTQFMGTLAYILMNLIFKGLIKQTDLIKETTEVLTYRDHLTGVYNRIYLEKEKYRLDQEMFYPLSVIVGDVNGLKVINDALGHLEGDQLLMTMAMILEDNCREEDIVFRVGGDEFCILMPRTTNLEVKSIMKKINDACLAYNKSHRLDAYVLSISLGSSTKTTREESLDMHIKIADDQMYKAKNLMNQNIQYAIMNSMKEKMFETCGVSEQRCEQLSFLTEKMGTISGFSSIQLNQLHLLSMMHDIGKISVDQEILQKKEKLTDEEIFDLELHSEIGYRIAKGCQWLNPLADSILMHHAHWDGSGYPKSLAGESIPVYARILVVADSFLTILENDPKMYSESGIRRIELLTNRMEKKSGNKLDPYWVRLFLNEIVTNFSEEDWKFVTSNMNKETD